MNQENAAFKREMVCLHLWTKWQKNGPKPSVLSVFSIKKLIYGLLEIGVVKLCQTTKSKHTQKETFGQDWMDLFPSDF